ncbi:hypothetical protein GCM10010967_45190 [Dyadobacter beijingensis]|uniref:Uncharacterized protein n=1 Tax=Dyadobacter beijingensis TaxID=365489 RepID=A0ABQ2ICW0_9BACT|nr:hypothetical protein GCM10010967_45190 [Dyadobacter beijingensis]
MKLGQVWSSMVRYSQELSGVVFEGIYCKKEGPMEPKGFWLLNSYKQGAPPEPTMPDHVNE